MHIPFPPPLPATYPAKNNLENSSNFQAKAHVQIILGKPFTSLAQEMRKMALKSASVSLPTHPTPTRWNVHLSNVTQSVE